MFDREAVLNILRTTDDPHVTPEIVLEKLVSETLDKLVAEGAAVKGESNHVWWYKAAGR